MPNPRLSRISLAMLSIFLVAIAAWAVGELHPKVSDIRNNPNKYFNERVQVDGYVTQYVEANSATTAFYFLKGDWGGIIKVRTSAKAPVVGFRYSVIGPVGYDPASHDPYISEEKRVELAGPQSEAGGASTQAAGNSAAAGTSPAPAQSSAQSSTGMSSQMKGLLGILGALAVAIVITLFLIFKPSRGERPSTGDFSRAVAESSSAAPPPMEIIEGKTIKMHAPPPNTIKLMPGWLEVVDGDDVVRQIRFYKMKGEEKAETTFGRAAGRPYVHVQLKPMTVSSRQAKISFDGGNPMLTNFASAESNPTRLNGHEMAVDEQTPLNDNDVVEMGEIKFKFHAS